MRVLGIATLVVVLAIGGCERGRPSPPPPLPALGSSDRPDVALEVDAERSGGGIRVELELAIDERGEPLTVQAWDDTTVVGERLVDGQVVLHVGLLPAGPEIPEDIYTYAPPTPPPPVVLVPGRTVDAAATFDGSGPELGGIAPADGDDVRRLDEVRVCVWSRAQVDEPLEPEARPAVCADDRL